MIDHRTARQDRRSKERIRAEVLQKRYTDELQAHTKTRNELHRTKRRLRALINTIQEMTESGELHIEGVTDGPKGSCSVHRHKTRNVQ